MTQYEILKMASIGICARMAREEQVNENTKKECGHENGICVHHLTKLTKQFAEVYRMMYEIEKASL